MRYLTLSALLLLAGLGTAAGETILIESVAAGGPAAQAGLESGDHLTHLAGHAISSWETLKKLLAERSPGDSVSVSVLRGSDSIELALTLAEGSRGASLGVRLNILQGTRAERDAATAECLGWIDDRYAIERVRRDFELEVDVDYAELRACVSHDTQRMRPETAVKACDSVFKVHCGGLEALAEIGEALAERCRAHLEASLSLDLEGNQAWKRCAEHEIFDRYSDDGTVVDAEACHALFLKHCGTEARAG